MTSDTPQTSRAKSAWLSAHPLSEKDSIAVSVLRTATARTKGKAEGIAARVSFNEIMEQVAPPEGVTFEIDRIGGIPGWWAKPPRARKGAAILHAHGGWFNWGSARAFRNLVGQIALRAGVDGFIPDYRLAPEHPFPAAVQDLEGCYRGMIARGIDWIAISGDSAGGNLALVLLSMARNLKKGRTPACGVAISPVTDLALTGESFESRADADPYFTRSQVAGLVQSYLGNAEPKNPLASPLYGNFAGLPPIRIHVGDDEVLLDDSLRYVERAVAAGVHARVELWKGMPHGFVIGIDKLEAAKESLDAIGKFMAECLS
jgi:acetyl esterase/lipase